VDYRFGTGSYALVLRSHHDYIGWKDWLLDLTLKYYLIFPHDETLRVPDDPNLPITTHKENVRVDVGDLFELDLYARYNITPNFSLGGRYRFEAKREDDVSGSRGYNYSSLEEETDRRGHVFQVYATYSTIEAYRRKQFPFPAEISVSYRDRFAGSNNTLNSQFIEAWLKVYF
jgi:hypothetical protein